MCEHADQRAGILPRCSAAIDSEYALAADTPRMPFNYDPCLLWQGEQLEAALRTKRLRSSQVLRTEVTGHRPSSE